MPGSLSAEGQSRAKQAVMQDTEARFYYRDGTSLAITLEDDKIELCTSNYDGCSTLIYITRQEAKKVAEKLLLIANC